jgi:hypothetical protein
VFPDCTAVSTASGERIRIEFEYRSSSFWHHLAEWTELKQEEPTARWWIVCWFDDRTPQQRRESEMTVVALGDIVRDHDRRHDPPIVLNWYDGDRDDAEALFRWRAEGLSEDHRRLADRLLQFGAEERGIAVRWAPKPDLPSFSIWSTGTVIECFKVYANGRISFPFSRWDVPEQLKTSVLAQLDVALGKSCVKDKIGCQNVLYVNSFDPAHAS